MNKLIFGAIFTVMFFVYSIVLAKGVSNIGGVILIGLGVGVCYTIPVMHIFGIL